MRISDSQIQLVNSRIEALISADNFYGKKLKAAGVTSVSTPEEFEALPFSSGTTGLPVIIPYTKKDVEDWAIMFARCFEYAGITKKDRIHITPGYGLWTAGIGFQAGCERLGAMAIPMGPGTTEKQLKMMMDMESTVLCSTSSYALLLSEEIEKQYAESE